MYKTRWAAPSLVALMAVTVGGCTRADSSTDSARHEKVAACAKEGDRCEFAAGKIGLCTASVGSPSLTCVSLH